MDILIDFVFEALWFMAWWGLMIFAVKQFLVFLLECFTFIAALLVGLFGDR